MLPDSRARRVALFAAVSGCLDLALVGLLLLWWSLGDSPRGTGVAIVLAGIVVVLVVLGLVACVEAAGLWRVDRSGFGGVWPRRLLLGGAAAGGLAALVPFVVIALEALLSVAPIGDVHAVPTLALSTVALALAGLGLLASVLGHLGRAVERGRRPNSD